jgi:hypothetical protein
MPNAPTTLSNVGALSHHFSVNQGDLALKDNLKEEILGCRCLFQ